ncbi:MAG TPA: lipoyl(octanoyl) transferase LipB [Gemmatimonadales bacterium]|nr:lipoyl(octanoyl) transferase LipB [Gemmatimonadales bacterium]
MTRLLRVLHAGTVDYQDALAWQRELATARIAGHLSHDTLLLLEHPPVLTLGRAARPDHIVHAEGIQIVEVERGGDVTFHGPGQLVGYPILDLARHRRDLHWYLRTLEEVLIAALAALGVSAKREPGYTGVWTAERKIASLGVHVRQWVTWHGFALNVTTELGEFARIVPCGIRDVEMTSVARELGLDGRAAAPDLGERAIAAVVRAFEDGFGLTAYDDRATRRSA